jgi:hypothetical protein
MITLFPGRSTLPSASNPLGGSNQYPTQTFGPGMSGIGWFRIPSNQLFNQVLGWATSVDKNGQVWATDQFGRKYACRLNDAYELVFQTFYPVW